jgi:hypothetical protein
VSESQSELFEEIPAAVNPSVEFETCRIGEKIVPFPTSVWKDGRIRADLSAYGAGVVVSRNKTNLNKRVEQLLGALYEEFQRVSRQVPPGRPRTSNKRALAKTLHTEGAPKRYINPFLKGVWNFSKAPHWLLVRREPSLAEKLVYTRLTYSPRERENEKFCKKDVAIGAIRELNQSGLASELGLRRECVCGALKSLQNRGLIAYTGKQGAKGCIQFPWHPWMVGTCALNAQAGEGTCAGNRHAPVIETHFACAQTTQLSECVERGEYKEAAAPELSDKEWLANVVCAKYQDWRLVDLQAQWKLHGVKATQKGRWIKGDREHFLKAWMPKARNPGMGKPVRSIPPAEEPEWWRDFLDECYPNAAKREFTVVSKLEYFPELLREGHQWAVDRNRLGMPAPTRVA